MSDIEAQPETTQFGPFLLDRRRRLLLSGGKPVKIGTMQFDLLAYLIDHRDQAPTRDDITAHVWRGLAVGTNSLSVQLSALRKVLAENGGDERLIITLPGQRYRFVGEVVGEDCETAPAANAPAQTDPSPPLPSSPRRRGLEIGAGFVLTIIIIVSAVWSLRLIPFSATVPAVPLLSIVVLPFRNLSDNKSDDHLADAVTDDLTVKLARTPGSFVIARETANAYLARGTSPKDIGAALRVRYLIDGTVDPEESTLRITVKLIDTSTGAYVWAKTLGVARDRISEVRDLIVGRIMSSLDLELVEAESTRSLRDRPDNPGAIDLFFQARSILDRGDLLPDYNAAQDLLEKAIKLQPDFGDALAELGWMLVCKLADDADPQEETDAAEAKSMVTRALKLSRDNPRALAAGARLLALAGDYPGAVSNARAALSIEPSSADADLALANAEFYQGHMKEAEIPLVASLRIDPEGPTSQLRLMRLGNIKLIEGDYPAAIQFLRLASDGHPDPEPGAGSWSTLEKARWMMIAAYQLNGETDKAHDAYIDYDRKWPHRTIWRMLTLAPRTLSNLKGFGRIGDALQQAGMRRFADENVDDHVPPSVTPLTGDYFVPTPRNLPDGVQTLDTQAMKRLMGQGGAKLVIDLGTGTSVIDGAEWADDSHRSAGDSAYVEGLVAPFAQHHPGAPVVIMGDGTYGATSYNEVLHLKSLGYDNLKWYRGGEEAWVKAGYSGIYRRMD